MITSHATTKADIRFVLENASKATRDDLDAIGASVEEAVEILDESIVARTIFKDDVPVIVMGCRVDGDGHSTWLFYTDRFYTDHEAFDEQIRKELDVYPPQHDVKVLRVVSILSMPGSEKWMNGFGFHKTAFSGKSRGHTFYVLERRYDDVR